MGQRYAAETALFHNIDGEQDFRAHVGMPTTTTIVSPHPGIDPTATGTVLI